MTVHAPFSLDLCPDAGWPETDLGHHSDLELAAMATQIGSADQTDDTGRILVLMALAEIGQEINRRAGTPTGPTLPTSAQGGVALYTARRRDGRSRVDR